MLEKASQPDPANPGDGPLTAYQQLVNTNKINLDQSQMSAILELNHLQQRLIDRANN